MSSNDKATPQVTDVWYTSIDQLRHCYPWIYCGRGLWMKGHDVEPCAISEIADAGHRHGCIKKIRDDVQLVVEHCDDAELIADFTVHADDKIRQFGGQIA